MAKQVRKRKIGIKVRQNAQLVKKNDNKRETLDTLKTYRKLAPTRLAGDNAANFRIKIRKKH